MIRVVVRGEAEMAAEHFAEHMVAKLREAAAAAGADVRILGPAPAPIAKLRGLFRFHALLQDPDRDRLRAVVRKRHRRTEAAGRYPMDRER